MMKTSLVILFLLLLVTAAWGQKFTSEKGQVSFYSDAAIEDIEAINSVVGSLFNATTGELVYIMKIRDFVFHKALMREHFNEKYMESEKFPKATFQGKIIGFKPGTPGEQKVKAVGKLNIHGVTRDIDVPGTVELQNGKLLMKSKFMVKLEDYNIKIPTLVWQNIAEEVQVTIDFIYKPV
jgi:hypothetical protein